MNWGQATKVAGAGLLSLAVCLGGAVATVYLLLASSSGSFGGPTVNPMLGLAVILVTATLSWCSLWLPALARGVPRRRALAAVALSGSIFLVFVVLSLFSLASIALRPLALLAFIGTPVAISVVSMRETGEAARRTVVAVAGAVLYVASLSVLFLGPDLASGVIATLAVAATSWPLLPALAALTRTG